ncbi:sensor histidine kinase [Gracilimonas sediminicola]|uniref:sensor histidine kinase n=2 Tax=Gracilimonas TaxID=649462 RepID=UPI0038D393E6
MTINQEKRISIDSVKTKLIDNLGLYGAIVALVAFLIPQIPFKPGNLDVYNYIDLTVIISVFVFYYHRDKFSLPFKGFIIIVIVYLFFVMDLYQHGLSSTVKPVFVFIPFTGILVFKVRWAIFIYLVSILTYAIIAYGYLTGQIPPGLMDPALNVPYKWAVNGVILSLVGIIIAMFVHIFIQSIIQIIEQQDQSYEVLEHQDRELKQNIEEKKVLLQEIHHRVKNNLAVVSGLLDLQSGMAPDDFSRSALKLSTNRILSISKVHELLYQSEDVSRIHFKKYIKELAGIILDSFNKTGLEINLKLDIDIQYLNVNHGVPIGIILNELITNSLKHGFNEAQESYQIHISAFEEDEHYKIIYQDNGSGVVVNKSEKLSGLGITLVDSLLTQIEAESQLKTDGMYHLSFRFPKELS